MRLRRVVLWIMLLTSFLTGCSKPMASEQAASVSKLEPIQTVEKSTMTTDNSPARIAFIAPASKRLSKLEAALNNWLETQNDNNQSRDLTYQYNFVDLNKDGDNELLVLVNQPKQSPKVLILSSDYQHWLGSFDYRAPLIVLSQSDHSWLDLARFKAQGQYERIQMIDGAYQLTDKSKENVIEFTEISGVGYLSDAEAYIAFQLK